MKRNQRYSDEERGTKPMELKEKAVVVFDSGVGGLTVLHALKKKHVDEKFVYLADSENSPYGDKTKEQIIINVLNCFKRLSHLYEFKAIIIACNTASVYTKDLLKQLYSVPVFSVVDAATDYIKSLDIKETIDVLATSLTANSHAYKANLPNQYVREIGCPSFVPFIESDNYYISEKREKIVQNQLIGLSTDNARYVVLGCTHYPLIKDEIVQHYGKKCCIINPSELLAERVGTIFARRNNMFNVTYFTTSINPYFDVFSSRLMSEDVSSLLLNSVIESKFTSIDIHSSVL